MPLSLLDRHTTPPGGFTFWNEATRTRLTGPTLNVLADAVIRHRKSNELPFTDIDTTMVEIEEQLCNTMPPNICRDKNGHVKMTGTSLNYETITRGAATLFDFFVKNGRKRVSKDVANERARICGNCFANRNPEGCTSCSAAWLRELANQITGGEDTVHDAILKSCSYCGCLLRSKVWVPLEILQAHTPPEEFKSLPEFCWQVRESKTL